MDFKFDWRLDLEFLPLGTLKSDPNLSALAKLRLRLAKMKSLNVDPRIMISN